MRVTMENNDYTGEYKTTIHFAAGDDELVVRAIPTSLKGDNAFVSIRLRSKKEQDKMPVVIIFPNDISIAEELHRQLGACIERIKTLGTKDKHSSA